MSADLAEDITDYLTAQGVSDNDWPVFKNGLPADPPALIAVFETGGRNPEASFGLAYPAFQVRVRAGRESGDSVAARNKVQEIKDTLHALKDTVINATRYVYVLASTGVVHLGRDENGYPEFAQSFVSAREE